MKHLKLLGNFPYLSLCFIFEKNGLGYFFINSSGHPVHAVITDQTSKVLCQTSFWGRAKAESFSHFSLCKKSTI
jgi:hypothetical protein